MIESVRTNLSGLLYNELLKVEQLLLDAHNGIARLVALLKAQSEQRHVKQQSSCIATWIEAPISSIPSI
jgi:hypothetical protein